MSPVLQRYRLYKVGGQKDKTTVQAQCSKSFVYRTIAETNYIPRKMIVPCSSYMYNPEKLFSEY